MSPLGRIEEKVAELARSLDLRPTLERAADIGDLLAEAHELVRHGEWAGWLLKVGLKQRTAWDYIAVAKARTENRWPATNMTIKRFLNYMRQTIRLGKAADRDEARREAARQRGNMPPSITLARADCREFSWPRPVDLIAADPPWADISAYYPGMKAAQIVM